VGQLRVLQEDSGSASFRQLTRKSHEATHQCWFYALSVVRFELVGDFLCKPAMKNIAAQVWPLNNAWMEEGN